ncbi:MAG: energy transducer TonB [Bacteroidales bacterium]|jgi:TonB family protein
MKTTIIAIISIVLLSIAVSGKANANSITPGNLEKLIGKQISYPDFAKQQKLEGVVLVDFSVNPDGTITVNQTNASNASLKDYVVAKLKQLNIIPSKDNINKTYDIRFDFKYEK